MKGKKFRLYDFSFATAVISMGAYFMMFALFGYQFFTSESKTGYGTALGITLATFIFVITKFVFLAATADEEGAYRGKLFIPYEDVRIQCEYDLRFRESVIFIKDAKTAYSGLTSKEREKKLIRVQATPSNCKKLSEYLNCAIQPAPKPRRVKREKKNAGGGRK
ncbi:MAG: hypothetical protein IK047_06010 [Clostridia bacterium]|nr:hypothetical protein [Clostridia bacterium]MBR5746117.1 hypothetical protein [Clostridia bacterium]